MIDVFCALCMIEFLLDDGEATLSMNIDISRPGSGSPDISIPASSCCSYGGIWRDTRVSCQLQATDNYGY